MISSKRRAENGRYDTLMLSTLRGGAAAAAGSAMNENGTYGSTAPALTAPAATGAAHAPQCRRSATSNSTTAVAARYCTRKCVVSSSSHESRAPSGSRLPSTTSAAASRRRRSSQRMLWRPLVPDLAAAAPACGELRLVVLAAARAAPRRRAGDGPDAVANQRR